MVSTHNEMLKMQCIEYRAILEKFQRTWALFGQTCNSTHGNSGKINHHALGWRVTYAGLAKFGRGNSKFSSPSKTYRRFNCEEKNTVHIRAINQ